MLFRSGLLGTVLGLIQSLRNFGLGDVGTASAAGVTLVIGEALISTAAGLVVAIVSLAFYRLFQAFVVNQVKVFRKAGSELEVLYRQTWGDSGADIQSATPRTNIVQRDTTEGYRIPPRSEKKGPDTSPL